MKAARLKQIEEIYHAVAGSSGADAERFLDLRCGEDADLRSEVSSLLSFDGVADSFIDGSADAIAAEMFADEGSAEIIGRTVGRYQIERLVGEGGMGKVYLADDTLLGRKVALKILPPSLIEHHDRLKRFKQEAKAASALNHPNILTIHEFRTDGDSNYIVTEFVDGVTLRQRIRRGMSIRETLEIACQAASALAAAHEAGIVHRDIKPENIMIRRDGILKVLDFGLAKLSIPPRSEPSAGEEAQTLFRTEPGMLIGTASYMSPEQARGLTVDGRTDIWSLGVILFEMATGVLPFDGSTQTDTLVAILNQPVPMIKNFIDAPAELTRIIEKTLAKNVDERYRDVEELAADLKRLQQQLAFETELKRTLNDPHRTDDERGRNRETSTRMMPAVAGREPGSANVNRNDSTDDRSRVYLLVSIVVLVASLGIVGAIVWRSANPDPVAKQLAEAPVTAPKQAVETPLRSLNYSLRVQTFADGRYKPPFTLSGEMLFRNRDRIRVNLKSSQDGHLYILNQGPKGENGEATYNILFPSPATNSGSALLPAGQQIQIPEQSWFELDAKEGTELVWLVWSADPLPELESAKRFANPQDRGRISDESVIDAIEELLQKSRLAKPLAERSDDKKETQITGNADIVAHLIKLEHH